MSEMAAFFSEIFLGGRDVKIRTFGTREKFTYKYSVKGRMQKKLSKVWSFTERGR